MTAHDRAAEMLRIAAQYIREANHEDYTIFYDDAVCDRWCISDDCESAAEAIAAPDPALRPTMTDMMVDPDMLDAFMEANPLPPDPAAIREAALRDALDALSWTDLFGRTDAEKHVALEQYCLDRDAILALIKKCQPHD